MPGSGSLLDDQHHLEEECIGYRFLRDRRRDGSEPILFIRATNDPAGQLARALCDYCERPLAYKNPLGEPVEVVLPALLASTLAAAPSPGALRDALREDTSLLGRLLATVSEHLPYTLVLVIDQCEEVFTLTRGTDDIKSRKLALEMLSRAAELPGDFKIIIALRTEYYGRIVDRLRRGLRNVAEIPAYLLTDLDEAELVEAIARPTSDEPVPHSEEIPRDRYHFHYDEGVAEEIARRVLSFAVRRRDSSLPLVQMICTQLYERSREHPEGLITLEDFERVGGVEGGIRCHVEALLSRLVEQSPGDRDAFIGIFCQLYRSQSDGTVTTELLPEDKLRAAWRGSMPVDAMLLAAKDLKLLRVNSLRIGVEEERPYVSLGHDALANIALEWHEELKRSEAELKRSEAELKRREEDRRKFRRAVAVAVSATLMAAVTIVLAAWALGGESGPGGRGQRQGAGKKATNAALELVAATKTRATDKDRYEKAIQNVEGLRSTAEEAGKAEGSRRSQAEAKLARSAERPRKHSQGYRRRKNTAEPSRGKA